MEELHAALGTQNRSSACESSPTIRQDSQDITPTTITGEITPPNNTTAEEAIAQYQNCGPSPPPQPIDHLVHQLRQQSLRPQDAQLLQASSSSSMNSSRHRLIDYGERSITPDTDMPIAVDPDELEAPSLPMSIPHGFSRFARRRLNHRTLDNIASMVAAGDQCNVRSSSSPVPVAGEPDTPCGPDGAPVLEPDEGFCDDDDRGPASVSLRDASVPTGIYRHRIMRFRTSAEAASRCANIVHKPPRMRRRDKKRSSTSRRESISVS